MKERFLYWMTYVSGFLLIPYLFTCVINGVETALLNRQFQIENFIPILVALQIPEDYEEETIEAQAVIARTNLYYELESKDFLTILCEIGEIYTESRGNSVENFADFWSYPHEVYQNAVLDTSEMVLSYDGKIKRIPYHFCSGGSTRDGEEVFRDAEYSYLKSVESVLDKESDDYIYVTYFSEEELSGGVEIQERDQAGYVMSVKVNGNILEGEAFRQGMNLPSSNFSINKMGERYQIVCRGKGHGLGFSQYGGNKLAKSGMTWEEILQVYFPEMSIEEI